MTDLSGRESVELALEHACIAPVVVSHECTNPVERPNKHVFVFFHPHGEGFFPVRTFGYGENVANFYHVGVVLIPKEHLAGGIFIGRQIDVYSQEMCGVQLSLDHIVRSIPDIDLNSVELDLLEIHPGNQGDLAVNNRRRAGKIDFHANAENLPVRLSLDSTKYGLIRAQQFFIGIPYKSHDSHPDGKVYLWVSNATFEGQEYLHVEVIT